MLGEGVAKDLVYFVRDDREFVLRRHRRWVVQAVVPHFSEEGARDVVFMRSTAARTPDSMISIYSAAERGLAAFSDGLRLELGPAKNPRLLVEPAGTATEVFDHIVLDGDTKSTYIGHGRHDRPSVDVVERDG